MEKYILRKAFDDPEDPYLPESVLWRQKEQFSDGVGYDWVDGLKEHAQKASLSIEATCESRVSKPKPKHQPQQLEHRGSTALRSSRR